MPDDTTADNVRRLRPPRASQTQPEQLSFDEDWIDYWRNYTRAWPPLDRDQIDAIAAIVARIDQRRATATHAGGPQQRPHAA
ncbi:hypothetical protein [Nocardia stercoris]|uniref:Uncharacterized protein n=1 Tax=Nocardia stercoris TaxID=2483361 RepID=A0A3M2KWZ0_9NOCA|nr:hypothetical protein [Nocardia stercoris]RMI28970.1 hypothetical protein EBN03_27940 [Nocardia stercoris]